MNPLNAKKLSHLRAQAFILRTTGLSVKEIAKKLEKSERWVVKWSSRNGGFEDKKRTGRPKVLNESAKKVLKKARYKRGNSTRQLSQQLASKGLVRGKSPSGGSWKAKVGGRWDSKRNLCSPQSNVQLAWNLLSSTKSSVQKNWMCLFQLPNLKNDIVWGSQESQVPPEYQVKKKLKMDHLGRNDRPQSHWASFFTPRIDFDCGLLHQQHIRERSEASSSPQKCEWSIREKKTLQLQSKHGVRPRRGACTRSQGHSSMMQKETCQILYRKQAGIQVRQISTLRRIFGA